MAFIDYISRLFQRTPRQHTTAYSALRMAVVAALRRHDIQVGKGAGYPRVEVHSIQELERMDKEGAVRQLSMTVESISTTSMSQCSEMNEQNLERLTSQGLDMEGDWKCFGIEPESLQDIEETSDTNKIIYRLLQTYRVYVERVKS